MGRQPCCDKIGLKRGPWTAEEDSKLVDFILNSGIKCWRQVPKLAGLMRCGKSCRLRWINYLRPDLKRGGFTEAEDGMIIELHSQLGNRWSKIASHLPGRTDNEIKNHWNTRIKKKLKLLGLDSVTHEPINHSSATESNQDTHQNLGMQESVSPRLKEQTAEASVSGSNHDKDEFFLNIMEKGSSEMFQDVETGGSSCMDPLQNWTDNFFFWDGYNNCGDSFQ